MKNAPTKGWQYAILTASASWTGWSSAGPLPVSDASFGESAAIGAESFSVPVYRLACPESGADW